jgi:hypothetical protein
MLLFLLFPGLLSLDFAGSQTPSFYEATVFLACIEVYLGTDLSDCITSHHSRRSEKLTSHSQSIFFLYGERQILMPIQFSINIPK